MGGSPSTFGQSSMWSCVASMVRSCVASLAFAFSSGVSGFLAASGARISVRLFLGKGRRGRGPSSLSSSAPRACPRFHGRGAKASNGAKASKELPISCPSIDETEGLAKSNSSPERGGRGTKFRSCNAMFSPLPKDKAYGRDILCCG